MPVAPLAANQMDSRSVCSRLLHHWGISVRYKSGAEINTYHLSYGDEARSCGLLEITGNIIRGAYLPTVASKIPRKKRVARRLLKSFAAAVHDTTTPHISTLKNTGAHEQ